MEEVKKQAHVEKPNQGPLSEADWVAVAFALFVVLFIAKVLPKINAMLDARTAKIDSELKQASSIRAEAEKLLASAKKKASDAETAAVEMIATAKSEAKRIAAKAEADMNEEAARKMVIVEKKIKRAEQQAIENVKKEAVEEATKIATKLLVVKTGKMHKQLLSESIEKISSSIN
jgi:F-type H+-transporting ATPase subunit b